MSNNSLADILDWMQGQTVTHGWSAMSVCNRTKVNRLLEQQYISNFNVDSFLPAVNGVVELSVDGDEVLGIYGLVLGSPLLSFENASLVDSQARLTMDIVAGTVTTTVASPGFPSTVLSSLKITPQQGYKLFMDIDLAAVRGDVDNTGRVTLDLASGYNFSSNLVAQPHAQARVGAFFKGLFERLPPQSRVFELGMLDLGAVDKLSPDSFMIRTQAAPGGTDIHSDSYGDGAVVVFIKTLGNSFEGTIPSEMRYMIPDDRDPQSGRSLYSAALVVSSRAAMDWAIAPGLEREIGHGLVFAGNADSGSGYLTLRAVAGAVELGNVSLSWADNVDLVIYQWKFVPQRSNRTISLPFTDLLTVTPTASGELMVDWVGTTSHAYRATRDGNGESITKDFTVNVRHEVRLRFTADIDPQTGEVTFDKTDSSTAQSVTISGDVAWLGHRETMMEGVIRLSVLKALEPWQKVSIPGINTLALQDLLFPAGNALELDQAFIPGDLALFGNVNPAQTSFTLDPLFHIMKVGQTQQFSVEQVGYRAQDITWSVRGIDGSRAQGEITASGLYTAVELERMEKAAMRNVVTATYTDARDGSVRTASALVVVVAEAMAVSPAMSVRNLYLEPRPVELSASTLGDAPLAWQLIGNPALGTLQANGNTATYTPPSSAQPQGIVVQAIQAQDTHTGETVQAAVLLLSEDQDMDVTPAFHPGLARGASVVLRADKFPNRQRWAVVAGDGEVDQQGRFTAPEQISTPYSVVQCQVLDEGEVIYQGYSVIHLSRFANRSVWEELSKFTLKALTPHPVAYANGRQQIALEIEVQTKLVDGMPAPVTEEELASIQLIYANNRQVIGEITGEGIGDSDEISRWAVNRSRNHYRLYLGAPSPAEAGERSESARFTSRYVHTRNDTSLRVGAQLVSESGLVFYSSDLGDEANHAIINLQPAQVPPVADSDFQFESVRAEGSGAGEGHNGSDDFDFNLDTIEYYTLRFRRGGGALTKLVKFEFEGFDVEGEAQSGGTMVQWESDFVEETMCSFTGYALPGKENNRLIFNEDCIKFFGHKPSTTVIPGHEPADGTLLVSLHRRQDINYRHHSPYARPALLRVTDEDGNAYRLRIKFKAPDNRNELMVEVFP